MRTACGGPGARWPCASDAYAGSRVAGTRNPRGPSCQHGGRADLLVLFIELDAGLGGVERLRHLILRVAQAGHNAHAGHDDSSVALPRTAASHATGKLAGSLPLGRTICSCVVLRAAWHASRAIGADGETSMPTTLDEASSNATMWVREGFGFGRDPKELRQGAFSRGEVSSEKCASLVRAIARYREISDGDPRARARKILIAHANTHRRRTRATQTQ